ncbi:hypothetical protein ABZ252_03735 [Streptomyces sp. NPDC006175]|uniref:hypothetical protein n=1 Tax=unclassified Streptomyces TaxID=2593676 RepID=UPI0033A2525A
MPSPSPRPTLDGIDRYAAELCLAAAAGGQPPEWVLRALRVRLTQADPGSSKVLFAPE